LVNILKIFLVVGVHCFNHPSLTKTKDLSRPKRKNEFI